MGRYAGFAILIALLGACSSPTPQNQAGGPAQATHTPPVAATQNPVARYLELAGFRLDEKGPGKLQIQFAVINHSDADIGDLGLQVNLRAKSAKASDPPLFSFPATVPDLGPEEVKQVTVTVPTKLRVYELPDWQFIVPDFTVTSPR